jgi:redox-sensitive bicupin YhaK (pirin superfamily)
MSTLADDGPESIDSGTRSIEIVIEARLRDLGGFSVRRLLPSLRRQLVGPFIFFDHMGPADLPLGQGLDVRPHPHIELATVTYLFRGEIDHRDSLGSMQTIRPGAVNWMLAGRGIVHSERSSPASRKAGVHLHGIQSWVALPLAEEQADPRFDHHPAVSIPKIEIDGARLEIVAGTAYGERSPVGVSSPTLYVHAELAAGARLRVDTAHEERAAYVVEGSIACDGRAFQPGTMLVFRAGANAVLGADEHARVMLVGGAKLDGERHIDWNFVSSSEERIERAKSDWRSGKFPKVPGDETEYIPLP